MLYIDVFVTEGVELNHDKIQKTFVYTYRSHSGWIRLSRRDSTHLKKLSLSNGKLVFWVDNQLWLTIAIRLYECFRK